MLAPFVRRLDNAIHGLNHYPVDKCSQETNYAIHWIVIYLVGSGMHLSNSKESGLSGLGSTRLCFTWHKTVASLYFVKFGTGKLHKY